MAATYLPITAYDYAKSLIKNMPLETVQVRVLDQINKMMWMAANFRWTVGSMATIPLVANTQDYTVAIPSDFLYGIQSEIVYSDGTPPRQLKIEPQFPSGGQIGQPSRISFVGTPGSNGTARVYPKPTAVATTTPTIYTIYKKTAPVISRNNITTPGTLVFDDEWSFVYESGVLWLAYLYADDSRAGTTNYDSKGGFAFTGQRAIFEFNLNYMKEREKLFTADARMIVDPPLDK